ncbi:GNAT family N-acetyltransferase [Amycolatopsis sp. WAC 04169]|uniref:GNAT family N-acetyltransferase n=1 Tax=Amycolatopsis sp. WAC 04169 TaxID=2203197 RepID=UPI000F768C85|nr:GNAT family N-acetyltransferase [Amycolatopsis sp. WAC 04169]RSN25803.1 GNAT family N-acetyltransferase [Amycolatopsis sp. WAC 04169]
MVEVALRPVEDRDLDTLYELMRDPESVRMAAFIARDPDDREAFDRHMARLRTSPDLTLRAVTGDGRFLGTIGSFFVEGDAEITYWIDRAVWGRGVASRALALFLEMVEVRPLYARAASDNFGSLRVLRKAGFRVIGTEVAYASTRDGEIDETVLRLEV